jgi:hypothetical protein
MGDESGQVSTNLHRRKRGLQTSNIEGACPGCCAAVALCCAVRKAVRWRRGHKQRRLRLCRVRPQPRAALGRWQSARRLRDLGLKLVLSIHGHRAGGDCRISRWSSGCGRGRRTLRAPLCRRRHGAAILERIVRSGRGLQWGMEGSEDRLLRRVAHAKGDVSA